MRSTCLAYLLACCSFGCGGSSEAPPPDARYYAYAASADGDILSRIDTSTDEVTSTIPVGHAPYAVAISPDGATVYVSNSGDQTVSVVDARTMRTIDSIPVGGGGIAIDSRGRLVYVAGIVGDTEHVWVINSSTHTVIHDVSLGLVGHMPGAFDVALTPDDATLHAVTLEKTEQHFCFSSLFDCRLIYHQIDTETLVHSVFEDIRTAYAPNEIALSRDGAVLYEARHLLQENGFSGVLSGIPLRSSVSPHDLKMENPFGIALGADGIVFVTSGSGELLIVKDFNIERRVRVGTNPRGVSVTPDNAKVYVINSGDGTVSVVDSAKAIVLKTLSVGPFPITLGRFIGPVPRRQ